MQVHDGALYVNGKARNEPYIYQKPAYKLQKLTIPPNNVSCWFCVINFHCFAALGRCEIGMYVTGVRHGGQ